MKRRSERILSAIGLAMGLSACSVLATAPQPVAQVPQVDATSAVIHPAIWPKGQSGVASDPGVEAQVADLLSRMSLEDKVGQIIQPDANSVTTADIRKYHFGSVLYGGNSGPGGNNRVAAPEWLKTADAYYDAVMDVAPGHPAIPLLLGMDAVHGNAKIIGDTIFPHNIGLGAAHDPELLGRIGEVTATELRVIGGDWTFAPTIAVVRDDRWGRTYESYSEEPSLVAEYASSIVNGLQGVPSASDFMAGAHVVATAKHFLGDGGTDRGVDQGDNLYGEEALRDLFSPPYQSAVHAGVQTVMASYSSWRGNKMHGNRALLNDVLVDRFGFNGFVVGDWNGYAQLPGCDKGSCPDALLAGVDMYMAPDGWKELYANTLAQVRSGRIPIARLDEAVSRILRVKVRAQLFKEARPSARPYAGQWDQLSSPQHRDVARRAVRESLVLLKNENRLLPLSPKLHVLVAGDGADNLPKQSGGWTISWQGDGNSRSDFPRGETIFEGIRDAVAAAGGSAVLSIDGNAAEKADVAIVVFGENPYAEFQGDRDDVAYQSGLRSDLALIQSLKSRGIPVVCVFLSGRPLYVTPAINASDAFVAAWLPGSEGAGIADVLFSKSDGTTAFDFRGTLSFSWPRSPDQTPLNADMEPYYPLFPLGYGLTYAAPRNLGHLPEAAIRTSASTPATSTQYFDEGHAVEPWALSASSALALNPASDHLDAVWSRQGQLALTGPKTDLSRHTDGDMALIVKMSVEKAPEGAVTLGMGCGAKCKGSLDVTPLLRSPKAGADVTLAIRLSCFREAGADMHAIDTPFRLSSGGAMRLRLQSIELMPGQGARVCPSAVTS
jgi:beta-glucosidase